MALALPSSPTNGQQAIIGGITWTFNGKAWQKELTVAGGGTYSKPNNGIPGSDLSLAVQSSLVKADSAVQPVGLTKSAVGLGNVDNTSDASKPVSTATQTALNAKQNTLVSGNTIKTINGVSVLGSGDIVSVTQVAGRTGNVVLTKSDVGLSAVDNTSDANKPVSTATQTALNAKQNTLTSGTSIKTINGVSVLGSGDITIASGSSIPVIDALTSNSATSALSANQGLVLNGLISQKFTLPLQGISSGSLSTAVQTSLTKADTALQPTSVKTVNGISIVGTGDVLMSPTITSVTYDVTGKVTALSGVNNTVSVTYDAVTGRVSTFTRNGITKTITYDANGKVASYI